MSDQTVSQWLKFFKDAGIPSGLDMKYAIMFCDHRIQKDFLGDLKREYLTEMGIKAMGDVIAILKQAELVFEEISREKTSKLIRPMGGKRNKQRTPSPIMIKTSTNEKPKQLAQIVPKPPILAAEAPNKSVFHRLGNDTVVESPAVFRRLGDPVNSASIGSADQVVRSIKKTVTDVPKTKSLKRRSVLERLGPASDETPPVKKMIKSAGKNKPNIVVTSSNSKKKSVRMQQSDDDVSSSVEIPPTRQKTVVRMKPLTKPTKQKVIMKRVLHSDKKTSSIMQRLGNKGNGISSRVSVKSLTKSNLRMDRNGHAATKKLKPTSRFRSDMMVIKQPARRISKPISSNTVSSTTSAGIFRGKGAAS
uniref:SAM domain-containing protein n=1 Tax=Ciona savignyi TaxID=51511 RepID=H2ZFI2_CIOSA